jgi:biopolymer transport protein TolR
MALSSTPRDEESEDASPLSEINVTPMVDVMLVLLIIFMVATPLMMAGVPLQLPKTTAVRIAQPHQPIILSLKRDGQVFLGSDAVTEDTLSARLRALAQSAPDQVVYIRADRGLPYGQVMLLMGTIATAGLSHVSLLAEQAATADTK